VDPLQTLAAPADFREEIRKSRFHASAAPVADADEATAFIGSVHHSDASHHCWAWRIGQRYRFFDDGEPGGTAGKPILAAIDGHDLDRVAVVVVRWFGGIKLGAGGLMRAYGGCAAECLRRASKRAIVATCRLRIDCDFAAAAALQNQLGSYTAVKLAENFHANGAILTIELPLAQRMRFIEHVRDLTRGEARIDAA